MKGIIPDVERLDSQMGLNWKLTLRSDEQRHIRILFPFRLL